MNKPSKHIPFARIDCNGNEARYISEVLASGWLTTGEKVKAFENAFAEMTGARYALAVNSCTSALHLAVEAMGIGPRDKVLVPTMTFTATAEIVRYMGADPIFLDVDYGTALVTPDILLAALDEHPDAKALIVVHYGGQAARMISDDRGPGILEICRTHGLKVIEDAAHAFPARIRDRMVGALGDAICFSFYANKPITAGEGGMLTTQDSEIAHRASVMRLHGIDRDAWDRYRNDGRKLNWEYDVVAPGFKYNMPDVNAAIGLAQLERAETMRAERESCAKQYYGALRGIEHIDLPVVHVPFADHAWHLFPVVVKETSPVDRNCLIELLAQSGIQTSVHYKPLHRMAYYQNRYKLNANRYPNAEKRWRGCLSLPIYPQLKGEGVDYIARRLKEILKNSL